MGQVLEEQSDSSLKPIDILEALMDAGAKGLGMTEVTHKTGLNKSTVHRLLLALTKRDYVLRDESTKRYKLGYKVLQFANAYRNDTNVKELIHPYLVRLSEQLRETVHLMQQDGTHCVFADKIDSPHDIGLLSYIGKRSLMHYSAGGKVILAYLAKEERDRIIAEVGLPRLTQYTITEREVLEYELQNVNVEGFAWNRMEDRDDIIGIAAPVFGPSGKLLFAISVAGPAYRFTLDIARQATIVLKETVRAISERLGYLPSEN